MNPASTTTEQFNKMYVQLNEEQKKAVDTIEGPVMVIAGPGTGKTQVLGMRAANILERTQMLPSNILCLTYTTSGTKEMRERLRTIIGPDAYGITVSTIHSFCNDIIQQHPHIFIHFRAQEQISEIEQLKIVRKAIEALGLDSSLYNPVSERDRASDVLGRIAEMKKEGIAPKDLKEHIDAYAEEIKKTPTGRDRDLESKSYKNDQRKVSQFEDFITIYETYQQELSATHRYDYNDMILTTLKALKENDWLLETLQVQYQYILVDEFQDLNGAQNEILDVLTTYAHVDHAPNIFVVGDDDQAIFRFQGASIGNMHSFIQRFQGTELITLTQNYRSEQPILDAASEVIQENKERLEGRVDEVVKTLTAANRKGKNVPRFIRYPDVSTEYAGIAKMLKEEEANGVPWKEMAVICRRNAELLEIADVLSAAGIPAVVTAKQDLVQHSDVLQAINLLRAVQNPDSSSLLSAALSLSCFSCSPEDLGRLWMNFRTHNREGNKKTLHEYILTEDVESKTIKEAHRFIIEKHSNIPNKTLTALVAEILTESNLLPSAEDKNADPRLIAGLHAYYEFVKSRCYEAKAYNLKDLLYEMDQYRTERKLKLEYDLPQLVQDGVQLMTAHGSKGLEFECVIMPNLWFKNWGNRGSRTGLSLPDNLIFDVKKEVEKNADQEDERRLYFVALTRAKSKLRLLFSETKRVGEKMQDVQVSSFVAETSKKLDEVFLEGPDIPTPIETLRQPPLLIDVAFKAFLEERLETYELSVTALNVFLDEDSGPQKFLWEQLLQRPSDKKPQMAFGTAVHAALEERNFAWQKGDGYSVENLLSAFQEHLAKEILTDKEMEQCQKQGREILQQYGEETSTGIPLVLSTERTLHSTVDDVPIKGKVDRIDLFEPNGRTCRVLDYKTGRTRRTEDAVRKDDKLMRQLIFYKILCDTDPKFIHEATLFTLDFIGKEGETRKEISITITQEEVNDLKGTIKNVWGKIKRLEFV